jgi:hypothetical protein
MKLIFEMVNSMETYIIYCMAFISMVILRLRLWTTFEILNRPVPIAASTCSAENLDASASAYCAQNPGVWALWFGPDRTVVSKLVRPPPFAKVLSFNLTNARGIFISKFHELEIIYKGVLNNLSLRKRRNVFLPGGPAMRRISGHLMGIWKNKPRGNDGCQ